MNMMLYTANAALNTAAKLPYCCSARSNAQMPNDIATWPRAVFGDVAGSVIMKNANR